MIIKPNEGAQTKFLQAIADFVIYGGGRGGGKTWALLLEAARYCHIPKFNAVIFRRTYPQIEASGGLWDKSCEIFPHLGGKANRSQFKWTFPSGASCRFRHLKDEADLLNVQGAEICYIGLDELTHFTLKMFSTLLGANRSTCGVKPFIRASCNPDANSWVAQAVEPWLKSDGFPDPDRTGKVKKFDVESDGIIWRSPTDESMTMTFIPALVWDNPSLLNKDPMYIQRLKGMQLVERERFLNGNWKIKAEAGTIFKREWIEVGAPPTIEAGDRLVRYWDLAATTSQNATTGDYTVGLLMHYHAATDTYWVRDVIRQRLTPANTNQLIEQTAHRDGRMVKIRWQQEGGAAGVRDSINLQQILRGFDACGEIELRDKVSRALPVSYMCEQGKVKLAIAPWNRDLLTECELFPNQCKHDDIVDGVSGAFNSISTKPKKSGRIIY